MVKTKEVYTVVTKHNDETWLEINDFVNENQVIVKLNKEESEELATRLKSSWTKVNDKLPPEGVVVELFTKKDDSIGHLFVGKREGDKLNTFYGYIGNALPIEPIEVAPLPLVGDTLEYVWWRILELPKGE